MQPSRLVLVSACFAGLLSLSQCTAPTSEPTPGTGGSSAGGTTGTAGTTGAGGSAGSGNTTGGTTGTGGNTSGSSGTTGSAGSTNPGTAGSTAGNSGSAGSTGSAGRGGTTGTAGNGTGGTTTGTAGTTGRGGTTGSAGSAAGTTGSGGTGGTGPIVDQGGIPLAKAGDMATASNQYLNLGEMRLINNRWGSDQLKCTASTQKVYITGDPLIGWDFNRPACGGMRADPDFPEVEFGVAPFGKTSPNLTSPAFSSTTLLPIQIKNLTTATVDVQNFVTTIQSADPPSYWDSVVEFWISKNDPRTNDGGVYAEVIAFLGWENNRLSSSAGGWSCDVTGSNLTVTAGANSYTLCHQSDTWSNGQWRFFNLNVSGGPMKTFNGKVDVKAMLNWIMSKYTGFTTDMWLTRIEVGTEIDDSTKGVVRINNLVFEINGQTRGLQLAK